MNALWHIDRSHSELKTGDLRTHPNELRLRSLCSLISLGTELLVANGHVPADLHAHMRVPYMEGEFIFPVKYGYSMVAEDPETGRRFHLLHPHQDECSVDPNALVEIPEGIPSKRATLASNTQTALTGVWDGAVLPGERIAIVGFGMIGSLVAQICQKIAATQIIVFDPSPARKAYAQQFGFTVADDNTALPPFDVAFHSSSTGPGLQTAIDLVGLEGRVVELSWYGDREVNVSLGGDFHILRKRIIASQVSSIPGKMSTRWDYRRRMQVVLDLLKDPVFDSHITHELTLDQAAEAFNVWRVQPPDGLGYCIQY